MSEFKQTCVITGCNSGIGKMTALELANHGMKLLMLCRDSQKSRRAFDTIRRRSGNSDIDLIFVDLAEQNSIRNACHEIQHKISRLDILINNAAIYKVKRHLNSDQIELTFAVNHLAPFLLTQLLMPLIEQSASARIINVNSELHKQGIIDFDNLMMEKNYNGQQAYASSKMANYLCSYVLSERVDSNISVNCVHPGVISTGIFRDLPWVIYYLIRLVLPGPAKGAEPLIHIATAPELANTSGNYFYRLKTLHPLKPVCDQSVISGLWDVSLRLTGL